VTASLSILWRSLPLILLAAAWEIAARSGLVSQYLLPPFSDVMATLASMASGDLYYHLMRSIWRGGLAFAGAVVFGVAAGVMIAWYLPVRIVLNPILRCLYPMPKVALIPLIIIWLGIGDASKIALIFIGCLVPIVMSAYNGARGVDHTLLWTARSMGASRLRMLWDVVVPSATPELLNGIRTALALSFILLVSSELIVARSGLGYLIGSLGSNGSYDAMYAVVLTVAFIGFAADRLFQIFQNRMLRWQQ